MGVYLRLPDAVGHKFWRWHYRERAPRLSAWVYGPPQPEEAAVLGPVVERAHRQVDRWLGELVAAAGPDTNIVVLSDHGMTTTVPVSTRDKPEPETGSHHRSGLLLMAGPDLRPGVRIRGASVYDVTPTVLHLLGLPVPEDLPGRVLAEALAEPTRARPLARIARFAPRPEEDRTPIASEGDADVLEGLRALGYVVD